MQTPPKHTLSKSTFIKGCQCKKALYLNKHHRDLKDPITPMQEAVFSRGTNVGELATELFPGGKDATPPTLYDFQQSVVTTWEFINSGESVIYEACFQFDEVLAALDILIKKDGKWHAYEVKSSTKVSDTYLLDASLQYHVITSSGLPLESISIVHLNNKYERIGELNIKELFKVVDITNEVLKLQKVVQGKIPELKQVLKLSTAPDIKIGKHCSTPYNCDFTGHCWQHLPAERSVFSLSNARGKDWELYEQGIYSLNDVPADYPLNEKHRMQINGYQRDEKHIDHKAVDHFLNEVSYPLYYFDFETIQPAVPLWDHSVPYQQLAFQYSLHYQSEKGAPLDHMEYLAETNGSDPRIALMEQLIKETERPGDIWVYNIGFERRVLKEMGRQLPQYNDQALVIAERLKDLMIPFQKRMYYTPDMDGRYSIKNVLPALIPELSYSDLDIQDGGSASRIFEDMVNGTFEGDVVGTRKQLLEYCKMDTFAMVKLLEKLEQTIEPSN